MPRSRVSDLIPFLLLAGVTGCHGSTPSDSDSDPDPPPAAATEWSPCIPGTCEDLGAECGDALDGCGEVLSCGACPGIEQCGGGGPNRCGPDPCTPRTCDGRCGSVSDGCGEVLDCGACSSTSGGETSSGTLETTGFEPPIPTFWEYRSEDLSDEEIDAYNDPATGAASLGVNQAFHFDLDHPDYWFKRDGGQTPFIDEEGLLTSVRQEGDANEHSGITAWADGAGYTTEPDERSFSLHHRYRFGFDFYLPPGATAWIEQIDWAIILQCHQVSDGSNDPAVGGGRNPPFALNIQAEGGAAYWTVVVRGDDRQYLPDKNYQYGPNVGETATGWASMGPAAAAVDRWYRFEVEVVWSYLDLGETKVWIDDELVYDNSARKEPEFKNCFNDWSGGVNIGAVLPYFGLYNYDRPSYMEVKYDNMWIADLGPVE